MPPLNPPVNNPPAKLSQDITYDWSPQLLRISERRYILRKSRRTQVLLPLLLVVGIFFLVKGVVAGWIFIGVSVWIAVLFLKQYLRAVAPADEKSDRQVTVRVEPESITFRTTQKESTFKWPQIKEAWSSPDVLMLFPRESRSYIALPVASLGDDLRQYVETNITQSGGKVT